MAKVKARYVCQACGSVSHRWQGQCADCAEWNTLVQESAEVSSIFAAKHNLQGGGRVIPLVGLETPAALPARLPSGIAEFDRAIGGGTVAGSAMLVGGDPGIGKSTLLLQVALGVDRGRYRLQGKWAPAPFLKGKLQRLTTPVVDIRGNATLKDRILDGQLIAGSPELRAVARGALDLADNRFQAMRLGVDLLKPPALFPNMTGKSVRLVWTLDGPFATADYSYRLTSPDVKFDQTGFVDVRAEGRGRFTPWPMRVPLRLQARAITGVGDVAGAMLANPRLEGWLAITPKLVRGDGLALTSAKWNGKMSILIDLVTGRFEVLVSGAMKRYLIPGLGIVDVLTDLKVVPGPNGKGSHVVGTAKAWVRRL